MRVIGLAWVHRNMSVLIEEGGESLPAVPIQSKSGYQIRSRYRSYLSYVTNLKLSYAPKCPRVYHTIKIHYKKKSVII